MHFIWMMEDGLMKFPCIKKYDGDNDLCLRFWVQIVSPVFFCELLCFIRIVYLFVLSAYALYFIEIRMYMIIKAMIKAKVPKMINIKYGEFCSKKRKGMPRTS